MTHFYHIFEFSYGSVLHFKYLQISVQRTVYTVQRICNAKSSKKRGLCAWNNNVNLYGSPRYGSCVMPIEMFSNRNRVKGKLQCRRVRFFVYFPSSHPSIRSFIHLFDFFFLRVYTWMDRTACGCHSFSRQKMLVLSSLFYAIQCARWMYLCCFFLRALPKYSRIRLCYVYLLLMQLWYSYIFLFRNSRWYFELVTKMRKIEPIHYKNS